MKSTLLFLSALFAGVVALGQDTSEGSKKLIKLNFDGLFDARYQLGYEQVLGRYTSVQFNAGLIFDYEVSESSAASFSLDNRKTGFVLTPEFRVYMSEFTYTETPKGFFVGFFARMRDFTERYVSSDEWMSREDFTDVTTVGAGFHIGFQYFTSFGLGFDAWLGPEFRYRTQENTNEVLYADPFPEDQISTSSSKVFETVGFAGIGIVYAF